MLLVNRRVISDNQGDEASCSGCRFNKNDKCLKSGRYDNDQSCVEVDADGNQLHYIYIQQGITNNEGRVDFGVEL